MTAAGSDEYRSARKEEVGTTAYIQPATTWLCTEYKGLVLRRTARRCGGGLKEGAKRMASAGRDQQYV